MSTLLLSRVANACFWLSRYRERAEAIRRHNFAMSGVRVPRHRVPPRPTVTSAVYGPTTFFGRVGVRVYWQGSAGAKDYSVQRAPGRAGPWRTICRRCATDVNDGHVDLSAASRSSWYRVIPYPEWESGSL